MSQQSNESKKQEAQPLFSAYNPSGEKPTSSETAPSFGSFPSMFATKTSNVEKSAELAEQQRKLTGSAFSSSSASSAAVENKNSVGTTFGASSFGKTGSTVPGLTAAVVKKDAIGYDLNSAFNASSDKKTTTFGATPLPFSAVQSDAKSKTPESGPKKDVAQVSNPFASTSSFGNNEPFGDPNSASFTGKSSFLFTNPNPSAQSGTLAAQQELAQKASSSAKSTKPFSAPTLFGSSPLGVKPSSNTTLQSNTQPPSSVFGGFTTAATEKHNTQALTTFGGFNAGNKEPSQNSSQQRQSAFGKPNTTPFDTSRLGQRRPSNGQKKSVTFSVPLVTGKREMTPSPSPSTSGNSPTAGMFNFPIQNKSDTAAESNADPSKLTSSPFTFAQPAVQTNKEEASSVSGLAFSVPNTLNTSSPFTFQKATPATTNKESNTAGLGLTFQKTSATSDPKTSSPSFTFEKPKAPATGKETSATEFRFTKPPQILPLFSSGTEASTNIAPTTGKETSTTGLIFTKPPQAPPLFSSGTKASTNTIPPPSFALKPTISPTSITETSKTGLSSSVSAPSLFGNIPSSTTAAPSSSGPTNLPFPTLNFEEKNCFSFATIIDDLVKNLNISAHQLQPLLSQTMQRYETITIPFPIDNITKKTKLSELPQEAQAMLLQLESHIYGERQRSEAISRRLEIMQGGLEKTKVDSMAQDVHVLHHRLNIQLHEMKKVVEATQYQLVHVSAGAQNMTNANNTHRWLFGYARDDDYFVRLSIELSERLDEYKKCIWEVEKMAESLQQTSPYSSHDVGKIIDAQNKVFLGLASKVAALHETVGQLRTA